MEQTVLPVRRFVRPVPWAQRGYTLLELMMGLGIISVMGMVAIPQLVGATEEYRLNAIAREISGNVARARVSAITENADFRVVISDASTYVVEEDVAGTWTNRATFEMPNGFTLGASGATVQFHRWGNATPVAAFSVTNENSTVAQVVTSTSGRSYVQ